MRIHEVKILEKHFIDVYSGDKRAEIRFNDRDYKVGDVIYFKQIVTPDDGIRARIVREEVGVDVQVITHVLQDDKYLQPGYVMLSIVSAKVRPGELSHAYGSGNVSRQVESLLDNNNDQIQKWLKSLNWQA